LFDINDFDETLPGVDDQEARRRGKYLTVHARQLALQPVHGAFFSMLSTVNAEMGGIAALVQVNQSYGRNRRTAA
jgi:hypothetical protein